MADSSGWSEGSDVESFEAPLETPEVLFPLPSSRELFKDDQNCFTCKCNLDVPGLANRKKAVCLFCCRGSCPACLRFSYFHSETLSIEPMCITCRYKLLDLLQSQSAMIEKLRLERIELRKQLHLATEHKNLASLERNLAQKQFESAKKRLKNSKDLQKTQKFQETLSKKQKDLGFIVERLKLKNRDLDLKKQLLNKRLAEMIGLIDLLQQRKHDLSESEDLRAELNNYYFKIAKIREKSENFKVFGTKELMNQEIEDLELQNMELNEISINLSLISEDLKSQIQENQEKIESLETEEEKISSFREEISEEEEIILKSLAQQVKDLDDLIRINQKIQDLDNQDDFNLKNFRSSSILDTQVTEENTTNHRRHSYHGPVQKNCIKQCKIF